MRQCWKKWHFEYFGSGLMPNKTIILNKIQELYQLFVKTKHFFIKGTSLKDQKEAQKPEEFRHIQRWIDRRAAVMNDGVSPKRPIIMIAGNVVISIVLNQMSESLHSKKMTSLSLHDSLVEKSIIAQLPDSPPSHAYHTSPTMPNQKEMPFQREDHLERNYPSLKPQPYSFRDIQKGRAEGELGQGSHLRQENQQQKLIIKKLSQQLRTQKNYERTDLAAECLRLQQLNNKLQQHNTTLTAENTQLKKQLQQHNAFQLQRRMGQQEEKISEMTEDAARHIKEIETLTLQLERLRRENPTGRRSSELLRVVGERSPQGSRTIMHSSRLSQLELLENERFNLKLSEKNKEYQQLYLKFQSVENELQAAQEMNSELQRERKFLAERLSEIEIHTEGEQVVGELENKLVLMSTELMRLGNLSRTKTQENKELTLRLKESVLKREHLEKDIIERDKLILNYKEELRLLQMRIADERSLMEAKEQGGRSGKAQRLEVAAKQQAQALREAEIKNAILEEKQARLLKENEELQRENRQLSTVRQRNNQAHTKVLNLQAELNHFKEAASSLKQDIKRYESKAIEHRSDVQQLSRQREEALHSLRQIQEKLRQTQEELRRTQLQLEERNMEVREINHRAEEKLLLKVNEARRLEERVALLERETQRNAKTDAQQNIDQLLREIQRLEGVQMSLKLQARDYQQKLVLLAQENERLNLLLASHHEVKAAADTLRMEAEQKDRKIRELQKEVESAAARQRRHREDNEALREKLREALLQQHQTDGLQFQNRQLRDQIDVLKTQITLKEEEVRAANDRCQREAAERHSLLLANQQLNSRLNSPPQDPSTPAYLQEELERLREEVRAKGERARQLQEEVHAQQEVYSTFSAEIQRLNVVLEQRAREAVGYKKEVDFLQHKVATCEEALNNRSALQIASQQSIAEQSKSRAELSEGRIRSLEGELQLQQKRIQSLRKEQAAAEIKLVQALNERTLLEQRNHQLEYQLGEKTSSFRQVEESFKMTILEVRNSNQRLEQAVSQIENHYISKLEEKENLCQEARNHYRIAQNRLLQLQDKLASVQAELIQKTHYIESVASTQGQRKEEQEEVVRLRAELEHKLTIISQETERARQRHEGQIERLQGELLRVQAEGREAERNLAAAVRESSASAHTIDLLSTEIERLNAVLVENVQKIRVCTKKNTQLELQYSRLQQDSQLLQQKNSELQRETATEKEAISERLRQTEELNKELKYQLQEKSKDAERFLQRVQLLEQKEQGEATEHMRTVAEQMRLLREGNQKLEERLGLITREYEQLVVQLEQRKRPSSSEADEKMRIIGNYEATIKHLHEDNTLLTHQNTKMAQESDRLNQLAHQLQQRGKISEEKARVLEEKCRRLEERSRLLEERSRNNQEAIRAANIEKTQIQQKMIAALQEVNRLHTVIKANHIEIQRIQHSQEYSDSVRDKKGIFVIKEASEVDQRSRSASGNAPQTLPRHAPNPQADILHRYELLETVNKKLSLQSETLRKKNVEYEFKMLKLKEEFDLINRLIHQYREENDRLKENNKLLSLQTQRSHHSPHLSPQHSSVRPSNQQSGQVQARAKLGEEIDRLNKINSALQNEVHDLRLNASDSIALRRRMEENLSLVVILFAEVESLRMRLKEDRRSSTISPVKPT